MKLHIFILLTFLCLANVDGQRTRPQNSAETDATQQQRTRGRVRFSLPIDVDAELADIPSKAIRPEPRFESRPEPRSESRQLQPTLELKPTPAVRKVKVTTRKSSPYEVEEIVEDIPDKNLRKLHKARVITETRFEAANAPKKPIFEAFPRPEDEITSEDLFDRFSPKITKSTTERILEKKKELVEEGVQQKEVKKSKNVVKEEVVSEEVVTLNEESITLSKDIEENVNISSSLAPESTTSSEVSSTENEIRKELKPQDGNDAKIPKASRARPQPILTTQTEDTTNKARNRGRARPSSPAQVPLTTSAETNTFQRTRSRSRTTNTESIDVPPRSRTSSREIPSRAIAASSDSGEILSRTSKLRTSRRRTDANEESSSITPKGRRLTALGENAQEGPVRTRTGRKVNYPGVDNIPLHSENKVFTVKPRKGHNSVKPEEAQVVVPLQKTSRGRTSRGQQKNIEVSTEFPKVNSRRNTSRRRTELNQVLPSRKSEIKLEEKANDVSTASSVTSTSPITTSSSTTTERNLRRSNNQRNLPRSDGTSTTSTPRNSRGRTVKKIDQNPVVEKKTEPSLSSERKTAFRSRQRSRFIPPIIDEQKLEVLPLFESEAKTVEPIIRKGLNSREASLTQENEIKSKSTNEIISIAKPKMEVHTSKPIVRSTIETKVSEVISKRRVVRPIIRKRKKSKNDKVDNDSKKESSRGQKKAELAKSLNSSDSVDESDNYPEPFKALLQAKAKEGQQSSRTRSAEEPSTKKATISEKVVTVQRFTAASSTSVPLISEVAKSPKHINEDDNNIVPSSTVPTTRGTRRKFSLATKPPQFEDSHSVTKPSNRPNLSGRKVKLARSTVAPAQVSVITEISQSVQTQPRYHARFISSSTTEGIANFIQDNQTVYSTTPRIKGAPKTPRGLYSSRKASGKKKDRRADANNIQQIPLAGKKKNKYSARYRSDLVSRPGSTRPTSAPAYIPTVPTVTPGYVKQRIEDGMEIISIDEPVNTIPSDNLINGELLTPSNLPEKLLPVSLVTTGAPPAQPSEKAPVSIIERIIYSITAISSTVAPNKTLDETVDGPTKETAIFKIPSKKDQTKQTTDQTNEILTATTEKPTTIIERILSSINAIQSTSSPTVGISTVSSTARTPSSTITNTLGVIEELSNEQTDQQRTISQLLAILKSISPTPSTELVVVTPKTTFSSTQSPSSSSATLSTSLSTSSINPDAEIINISSNSIDNDNTDVTTASTATTQPTTASSENTSETSTASIVSNTIDTSNVDSSTVNNVPLTTAIANLGKFTETISISDFLATLNYLNAISPTTEPVMNEGITKSPNVAGMDKSEVVQIPETRIDVDNVVENLISPTESSAEPSSQTMDPNVINMETSTFSAVTTDNSVTQNSIESSTQIIESSSQEARELSSPDTDIQIERTAERLLQNLSAEVIKSSTEEVIMQISSDKSSQSLTEETVQNSTEVVVQSSIETVSEADVFQQNSSKEWVSSSSTEVIVESSTEQTTQSSSERIVENLTQYSPRENVQMSSEALQRATEQNDQNIKEEPSQRTTEQSPQNSSEQAVESLTQNLSQENMEMSSEVPQSVTQQSGQNLDEESGQRTTERTPQNSSGTQNLPQKNTKISNEQLSESNQNLIQSTSQSSVEEASQSTSDQPVENLTQNSTQQDIEMPTMQNSQIVTENIPQISTEQVNKNLAQNIPQMPTDEVIQSSITEAPQSPENEATQNITEETQSSTEQTTQNLVGEVTQSSNVEIINNLSDTTPRLDAQMLAEKVIQSIVKGAPQGITEETSQSTTEQATQNLVGEVTQSSKQEVLNSLTETASRLDAQIPAEQVIQSSITETSQDITEETSQSSTERAIQNLVGEVTQSANEEIINNLTETAPTLDAQTPAEEVIQSSIQGAPQGITEETPQSSTAQATQNLVGDVAQSSNEEVFKNLTETVSKQDVQTPAEEIQGLGNEVRQNITVETSQSSTDQTTQNLVGEVTQNSNEETINNLTENAAKQDVQMTTEQTAQVLVGEVTQSSNEGFDDNSTESPPKQSAQITTEQSAQMTTEQTSQSATEQASKDNITEMAQALNEGTAQILNEENSQSSSEQPVESTPLGISPRFGEQTTQNEAKEVVQNSTEEIIQSSIEPVLKSTEQSVQSSIEPVLKSTEQSVQSSSELIKNASEQTIQNPSEPVQNSTEETAQFSLQQAAENGTGEPSQNEQAAPDPTQEMVQISTNQTEGSTESLSNATDLNTEISEDVQTTPAMIGDLNILTQTTESSSQATETTTRNPESSSSQTPPITSEQAAETSNSSATEAPNITQNSLPTDNKTANLIDSFRTEGADKSSSSILQLIARLLELTGSTPNAIASTVTLEKTTVRPANSRNSAYSNFEVSPGSVTVFSANDVTSTFNQSDDGTTVTISSRTFAASKANRIINNANNMTNSSLDSLANVTSSLNETSSSSNDTNTNSSMTTSNSIINLNSTVMDRQGRLLSVDPQLIENNAIETTTAPPKDYYIFAILPNNTILRKRPSMYPNKNTPFIIVGVYPNNTVVQKFPNGTLIPEEPVVQVSGFDISANPQTPRPEITSNQLTQDSTRSDDNNQTLQTATKQDLPSTPSGVQTTTNQIPTSSEMANETVGEFDDIPQNNVTENVTIGAANDTDSNNGRDTEEVNIEENTISNNGNNKPEKIIEATNILTNNEPTSVKNSDTTIQTRQNIEITTKIENIITTLPPIRNNDITTVLSKQDQPIPQTISPELNLIEETRRDATTPGLPLTTPRYTNTPVTTTPMFEDYQLNVRSTTPYLIQRILGNFTSIGSTVGVEQISTTTEQATMPTTQRSARQRVTTLETITTERITTTRLPTTMRITTTQAATTQPPTTRPRTTQPPSTQPPTTQLPTTQPPTTKRPTTQPPTTRPPTTPVPTTRRPTTQPPTTQPPTTQPPTTPVPTTRRPTTQPPTTQPPTTQPPTTQVPTTRRPTTQPPTTRPPTTKPPTTQLPTTTKPPAITTMKRIRTTTQIPETTFWTTTRRTRTASPMTTQRFTITPRRTPRPTINTEPPTTTVQQPTTTIRRRSGRLRNTTPAEPPVRTVTVTPSTQTTELPQTELTLPPSTFMPRRTTISSNTIPTEVAKYESQTLFPIYTTPQEEQTTQFTVTAQPITKTPITSTSTLSPFNELRKLAEQRLLENFGELSTTNDIVSSTTPDPSTLQTTLKSVNAKVKMLTEQQKKDLQELARLEKEQAEILKQLSFLTRLNLGGSGQKPTRSPSNLASRVLEFAAERDKKTTTGNPLDLLSTLTNAGESNKLPPGTKDVSLNDLLRQFNVNPETVTPSNLVSTYGESTDAILAALLKEQGIGPSTPKTLGEQLKTTMPVQIPTERTTQKTTTRKRITTTTTPRPGPIMQGLNWLLNALSPPPTTKRPTTKKKVTTTERLSTINNDIDIYSSQPTEINPVVVPAPKRSTPSNPPTRASRKYKRPLHALSENELASLITQLEEAQKDPRKAQNLDLSGYDLSQTTQKTTTLVNDNAVQITISGKVGTTSKVQTSSLNKETVSRRKPTTPLPSTVSNSISDEVEDVELATKTPKRPTLRPVVLNPIPGIDDGEGETRVRGQLLSAAVNVTRALSQFLGSAIQDAALRLTRVFSDSSTIRQYLNASSIIPDIPTNTTQPRV